MSEYICIFLNYKYVLIYTVLRNIVQDWFDVDTRDRGWLGCAFWLFTERSLLSKTTCTDLNMSETNVTRWHTDRHKYCLCNVTQMYRAVCAQHTIKLSWHFRKMFFTERPGRTDICPSHLSNSLTHTHKQGWKQFSTWCTPRISMSPASSVFPSALFCSHVPSHGTLKWSDA